MLKKYLKKNNIKNIKKVHKNGKRVNISLRNFNLPVKVSFYKIFEIFVAFLGYFVVICG